MSITECVAMTSLQLVERFHGTVQLLHYYFSAFVCEMCFLRAQSGRIVPADITVVVMRVALKIASVVQF